MYFLIWKNKFFFTIETLFWPVNFFPIINDPNGGHEEEDAAEEEEAVGQVQRLLQRVVRRLNSCVCRRDQEGLQRSW